MQWLVEIHEDDWDYDQFASAVVTADTAEQAEALVRTEVRYRAGDHPSQTEDELWIKPEWRLTVKPAPETGVLLVHWHAG